MNIKFTDKGIASLKPQAKRYIAWKINGDGLGVRVSPQGKKTFVYMYRFNKKPRMMTLGEYGEISLQKAGELHAAAISQVKAGKDPGEKRVAENKQEREAETVGELAEKYISIWASKKRSGKEDERILRRDVLPELGHLKAKDVQKFQIKKILNGILLERGSPYMANRTLSAIRKMFNYGIEEAEVSYLNPCTGISRPGEEVERERVLNYDEIRRFWHNLEVAGMDKPTRLALKMVLATAQRPGEVAAARWDEIDEKMEWWTIPAAKNKGKRDHRVPINKLAKALLMEINAPFKWDSPYLFPSPRPGKHIAGESLAHAVRNNLDKLMLPSKYDVLVDLRKMLKECGADSEKGREIQQEIKALIFTPHDLRRTAGTNLGSIGVNDFTISRILNHSEGGVTKIYNRYSYDNEKRAALELWSDKLQAILSDENMGVTQPSIKLISGAA